MNSVRSDNLSLKYQSFTTLGCKDVGVRKFEFVAKTQFLRYLLQFPKQIIFKWGFLHKSEVLL